MVQEMLLHFNFECVHSSRNLFGRFSANLDVPASLNLKRWKMNGKSDGGRIWQDWLWRSFHQIIPADWLSSKKRHGALLNHINQLQLYSNLWISSAREIVAADKPERLIVSGSSANEGPIKHLRISRLKIKENIRQNQMIAPDNEHQCFQNQITTGHHPIFCSQG